MRGALALNAPEGVLRKVGNDAATAMPAGGNLCFLRTTHSVTGGTSLHSGEANFRPITCHPNLSAISAHGNASNEALDCETVKFTLTQTSSGLIVSPFSNEEIR